MFKLYIYIYIYIYIQRERESLQVDLFMLRKIISFENNTPSLIKRQTVSESLTFGKQGFCGALSPSNLYAAIDIFVQSVMCHCKPEQLH